jgi:hypothetical protein
MNMHIFKEGVVTIPWTTDVSRGEGVVTIPWTTDVNRGEGVVTFTFER